jgi:hypothetical protein
MNGTRRQLLAEINEDQSSGSCQDLHRDAVTGAVYTYGIAAVGTLGREGNAVFVTVR